MNSLPNQNTFIVSNLNDTVDVDVTITVQDIGISGLKEAQYAWVKDGERINYEDFDQNITLNKTRLGIGTYTLYVRATDNAGNVKEETRTYTINYDNQAPKITIQSNPNQNTFILANPNATTDLRNYNSIKSKSKYIYFSKSKCNNRFKYNNKC